MHHDTVFPLKASQNPRYLIHTTEATVSGLKTAMEVGVGPLHYYTKGKWLFRHRIQRLSEFVSTVFPYRNLDYVH